MNKLPLKIFPIIILSIFMLGCYTQMKFAKAQMEEPTAIYVDEDYYYLDSTQAELGNITNIYVYTPPYYYDPWYNPWYDPWYWRPTPRWGWYVGFSFYWGDPYWYPWGWYGRCCYPYVVPYAGYYAPYPSWGYYYYPPYYHPYSPKYAKRPFDRRSPISPRSVARGGRGGGSSTGQEVAPITTRSPRGVATASGSRLSGGESSRIVRRGVEDRKQITGSSASSGRSIETRGSRSSSNRSAINSNRSSSRRSSGYKPSSSNRRSSSSSGYNNRRSSGRSSSSYKPRSSSSGSRSSSGRSSSGSSSSSSSGSSSRSSSSGGSRSSSRK